MGAGDGTAVSSALSPFDENPETNAQKVARNNTSSFSRRGLITMPSNTLIEEGKLLVLHKMKKAEFPSAMPARVHPWSAQ
jgi:hypothetical protein